MPDYPGAEFGQQAQPQPASAQPGSYAQSESFLAPHPASWRAPEAREQAPPESPQPPHPAPHPGDGWLARADLVTNGGFEEWDGDIPVGWECANAWPEEAKVHTGRYAVRLGTGPVAGGTSGPARGAGTAGPGAPAGPEASGGPTASAATLVQVMRVSAGTVYQLGFSALGTGDTPRPVELQWLDETGQPVGEATPPILLPPVVLPQYAQYSRIVGPAPAGTHFVQVRFSKTGAGYLVIDDVSLFRLY